MSAGRQFGESGGVGRDRPHLRDAGSQAAPSATGLSFGRISPTLTAGETENVFASTTKWGRRVLAAARTRRGL